ncbi:T9SS type B sorting domain-containing protein [Chishuiella changwenlii]|uniref:T9SS type B sorting domain-containing protein n=1 Tax=Chishuiella changwenlii TaxID=1434701 RepID=UPI002FD9C319
MNIIPKYFYLLLLIFGINFSFGQYYVKDSRTGNGSGANWDNAMSFDNVADLINASTTRFSVEIKLYKGVIKTSKKINFSNYQSVKISGGYSYEIDPETGNPIEIISSDPTLTSIDGQNITKIFTFNNSRTVELTTFTIQNANLASRTEEGSAISVLNTPKLNFKDITVKGNNVSNTSAVYVENVDDLYFDFVDFKDNYYTSTNGTNSSALYINNSKKAVIENFSFSGNRSYSNGGALYVRSSNLRMEQVAGNSIGFDTKLNFENNYSTQNGAGIYNDNSDINLTAIYFINNTTEENGGAMYLTPSSKTYLNRIHFINNKAKIGGGIYNNSNNELKILSSLVSNNTATVNGGGIYNAKNLAITNVTFVKNTNSAILFKDGSINTVVNSIFYLNTAQSSNFKKDVAAETIGSTSFTNNITNNIVEEYSPVDNLIGIDPLFVNNDSDYTLQTSSPAFNAGKESLFQLVAGGATSLFHDLDKRNRHYGTSVDLGAYELTFDRDLFFADCPAIISPYNSEENVSLTPVISWNKITNANQYKLTVIEEPSNTVVSATVLDNSSSTGVITYNGITTNLKSNTWHTVLIHPENTLIGISKENCSIYRFKTEKVPTIPACTSVTLPANGGKNVALTPIIRWNKVEDATSYLITIGTTPDGNDILDNYNVGDVDNFTLTTALKHATTYYVKITATNSVGPAVSCSVSSFETIPAPDPCAPVKLSLSITKNDVLVNVINGNNPILYRIDEGEWVSTNIFNNVSKGSHKIEIKTVEDCIKSTTFIIPDFYNFISPNGDGVNDKIDFSFLSTKENPVFRIVDRQGKNVFEGSLNNNFIWNGKRVNGTVLPSDSYWYLAQWNELNSTTPNKLQGTILLKNN